MERREREASWPKRALDKLSRFSSFLMFHGEFAAVVVVAAAAAAATASLLSKRCKELLD